MIRLTSVTRKLQAVLAGAVTTNQLPITVCYTDATTTSWLGGTTVINTNSTTPVDICAAPAASTVRDIDYISVRNSDTVPATVTIRYNDNSTLYTLFTATLAVGDILIYVHGSGVHVLDSSGSVKSTVTFAGLVVASGKTLTVSNTLTLAGTDGSTLNVGTGGTLGTAAYTATTAYEAAGAIATHASLTTGVHGLAITAGQTLTVTTGGTLGSAAYTATSAYEAAGAIATHAALQTGVHGLAITAAKTLTVSKSMTLTAADDTGVYTFPTGTASLARIDAAQTFAGTQTFGGILSVTDATDATNTTTASAKTAGGFSAVKQIIAGTAVLGNFLTAIPAGGATTCGFKSTSTANFGVFPGSGAPTLSAAKGSLYLRSDGTTTNNRCYVNTDGGTTWSALLTGSEINTIGAPGELGFGVGICPAVPSGYVKLAQTEIVGAEDYGNYQYSDGSIMVWISAFYLKWGTGANGLAINDVDIKEFSAFVDVAAANASGYMLLRAFYDGGVPQPGVFVDKYLCSDNSGVASSIKLGNPLSSAATFNQFSSLNGAPANAYYGAIAAAKTRGSRFFCKSQFISFALAMLSYAHARASTGTAWCAWYHATNNFPKGNNNTLVDINDTGVTFTLGSYASQSKTGSGSVFAKTTHNGQASGVCDLNGNMWEISPGITSDGTNYYALKTAVAMKNLTGGNTLSTDLWGATGIAANYDNLGATIGAAQASSTVKLYGSATQVFDAAVSGNAWLATSAGIPLVGGVGGTNAFGMDGFWDYRPNETCPLSGGPWAHGSAAGAWALHLGTVRGDSNYSVGFRAASYL